MQREIQEIQGLATKYSRAELGRMVQLGLLDPQKAMMAGMMIQRIEQQNAQPPQTTVAQDLLGMPPVPNQPQQPQAPQGMPPMPPQGGMPSPPPQQGPGIEALPTGDVGNYADGGIVAFADKGAVKEDEGGSFEYDRAIKEMEETARKEAANKSKKRDNLGFIKEIFKTHSKSPLSPDKKDLVDNPLNFNMGKGLWKGTYATPYDQTIVDAAKEAGVDPRVLWRLLYTESKFDPKAQSYKGKKYGYGMAQIAALHGIPEEDLEKPEHSIKAGAWILRRFLNAAGGNYRRALEGYKGAVSEAGKAAMAPHIDLVLGDSTLSPPAKKKKLPPLKKGEIASYPVPIEGMEVKREFGEPTSTELAAIKSKKKRVKTKDSAEDVYDIGSGNFITRGWDTSAPMRAEEYEQEGAPHYGGWFTPDEAAGLPEFNYAHGGITSLAHGGFVPRYAGEGSSQVTTSAVPTPDMFSYDPTMPTYAGKRWEELPEYKGKGNKLAGSLEEFFSNLYGTATESMPSQGTTRIDPKTGEPISLGEFMRRAEAERTEGARRSLPPIAKPTPKEATAEEKAAAKDVGARMPPVEVRPEPEPKEEAPKEERKSKEENYRGLKLPGLGGYNVDIPVYTGDMPQQTTPEEEYEKRTAQEKRVGYDADLLNKMISNIESKRGDAATEKDKAIGEAIMIASMKLMGARRGQEFQMLSEGAQEGFKAYQASMRDFKNRQEKLDERIETLKIADAQARRSGAESDIARAQRQQEMYYKAQQEFAKAKSEAAYRGAYLATTMRDTDANIFGNIASHQISAAASRSAQAPANIQLAERVAKEKGISFTEAYSLIQNMNVDPKEEMKLREKYAGDFLLRRQYKTVDDYLRAMGVGGGGGGGGKLQAGPDGKIRYVPGGQ